MQQFIIDGERHNCIDLKQFRVLFDLPDTFGVALFEPKNTSGLGRIDTAGAEMNMLRQAVLRFIPSTLPLKAWLDFLPQLTGHFQNELEAINHKIGLRDIEIEFAAAGFNDVCQALFYAAAGGAQPLNFDTIYQDWLNSTLRLSHKIHTYPYQGERWQVQIVNHVYGRVGLKVTGIDQTHYVYDSTLACPAEGFMLALLRDTAGHLLKALN